jgi:hypothetical protein
MYIRQNLLFDDCNMRSVGEGTAKTRVNINIFLSQDPPEDGFSDNDCPSHVENSAVSKFEF